MTTTVEKRNNNKFCEFHREVGHNTDECMHLRRQIEELIKAGKLSHVIKELKQGKDQPKAAKKGETSRKDKPLAILMAKGEENSSSPVNSSRNVKIPSSRRNTHSIEQHDNPTRMHDGLRTGSTAFPHHSSYRGKDQSSNSSGIPRANNYIMLQPNKGRTEGIVQITQTQPKHICLETRGHDMGFATPSGASPEHSRKLPSSQTKLVDAEIMKEHSGPELSLGSPWLRAGTNAAEAEAAFKQMKKLIAELPTLTAPMEKKELIVYLAAAQEALSTVLMTKREAKQITSVKGQILANFIVERPEDDSLATTPEVEEELPDP
ncbi:hypothetical protein Tco_0150507 [Tanacetum coccineum]